VVRRRARAVPRQLEQRLPVLLLEQAFTAVENSDLAFVRSTERRIALVLPHLLEDGLVRDERDEEGGILRDVEVLRQLLERLGGPIADRVEVGPEKGARSASCAASASRRSVASFSFPAWASVKMSSSSRE
jgi:hypothetical protein